MKVIYFDIDTLRPDHLGCYQSRLNTPNIDSLAQDSVRFTQAFASNTPCMPSRAALFTGRFGVCNGVETHGEGGLWVNTPKEDALCFRLCRQGVETVGISSFGRHPAPWYYHGFCQVIDPSFRSGGGHFQRYSGSEVNRAAREALSTFKGENLFLHLHYWDPHGPLAPPDDVLAQTPVPSTEHIRDQELNALCASGEYRGGEHVGVKNRQDFSELLQKYDAEILYTDKLVGEMIEFLKNEGIYDDCALILSADHGEQYGEAQMLLEHGTVHDSCIHIPMIVKFPHQKYAGEVSDSLVYGLDTAPTITSFFGIEPAESWDGVPLQNSMKADRQREFLVCDHGLYTCQRAVFDHEWKMVHTFNSGVWDFPEYALFNRKKDPTELNDLAAERPDILHNLQKKEACWLEETLHGEPDVLEELGKANAQHGWVAVKRYHSSRNVRQIVNKNESGIRMTGKERVYALLNKEEYDRLPVGFWMHFPKECFYGEKSVKAHLEYFEKTKTDIAKVMTEHLMPCDHSIKCADDWRNVPVYDENAPFIQAQAKLLHDIFALRTDLAPMATLHGAVASASHTLLGAPEYDSIGRYALMYHLRTNPDAFETGLYNIAQSLCSMEDAFIKAGAEGIYYAALGGESDVFTAEEHARYIAPLDRMVMKHAYDAGAKFVVLHVCKPKADLKRFSDYPCDIVNWGVRESGTTLLEGAKIFKDKIILGGFDHRKGPVIDGDMEGIAARIRELSVSMPDVRLILGSDCTLPSGLDYANIAAVVECLDAM